MKYFKHILSLGVFLCLASACSAPAPQSATAAALSTAYPQSSASAAPTETPLSPLTSAPRETVTPTVTSLSEDALRNMEFTLPVSQKTVKLVDGRYEAGSGADYLLASMADTMAFGNINGDGLDDAAVILGENMGGSGMFESLVVVFNQGGVPAQWAATQIGDRVRINAVAIQDHQVVLDILVGGLNDPMCCPSLAETQTYRLTKGGLFLTGLTSKTSTGELRSIKIESPANFSEAGVSVEVKGSVSIVPFENTLAYSIQDDTHHTIDQGSIQVKAGASGGPATFDATIALAKSSPGMIIHLDFQDVSAADGSILALGSVDLLRK